MIDPPGDGNRQNDQEEARMDTMGGSTDSRTAAVNETKSATAPLESDDGWRPITDELSAMEIAGILRGIADAVEGKTVNLDELDRRRGRTK